LVFYIFGYTFLLLYYSTLVYLFFPNIVKVPPGILQSAIAETITLKSRQLEVMKYLKMKYTLYAKKDHEILAAPGRNAQTIVTNQFNFIEVSVIINFSIFINPNILNLLYSFIFSH